MRAIDSWPDDVLATYQRKLIERLDDPVRTVRTEAARSLSRLPPTKQQDAAAAKRFEDVFNEWIEGQRALDDQPGTHTAIGTAYANLLKATENMSYAGPAEAAYKQALKMEPVHLPTIRNYAALMDLIEKNAEAESLLKRALAIVPKIDEPEESKNRFLAETNYELGWLLFRDATGTRKVDAAAFLKAAIDGSVTDRVPQARLYYGRILIDLNRFQEAARRIEVFRVAVA
ncbi:MAG: hypothetical protein QM775_20620 [Pirellulales bacterium]